MSCSMWDIMAWYYGGMIGAVVIIVCSVCILRLMRKAEVR